MHISSGDNFNEIMMDYTSNSKSKSLKMKRFPCVRMWGKYR